MRSRSSNYPKVLGMSLRQPSLQFPWSDILVSVTAIQAENVWRVEHGQYRDVGARSNHRYELLSLDFSCLYRRYYRLQGINVDIKPEININNWLNSTSPAFNPTIAEAIFHYTPRVAAGE